MIATTPTMTIGTLIRKTEPHQKCSSSRPPTTGPMATAEADRAGPDADRLAALPRVEDVGDDRQRRRHDRRGAEAHQRAGRDELVGRLRVGRTQRGDAEQGESDRSADPLAAEAVAEDAGGEEQAGEDQGVGVDRPIELALRWRPGRAAGRRSSRIATLSTVLSSTTTSRLTTSTPRMAQRLGLRSWSTGRGAASVMTSSID